MLDNKPDVDNEACLVQTKTLNPLRLVLMLLAQCRRPEGQSGWLGLKV